MSSLNMSEKALQIIGAATAVFSQKGYAAARIEEIAQRAGVGKGTVYEYFESKQHLFEEMLKYSLRSHADVLLDALKTGNSLFQIVENMLLASFNFARENLYLTRILVDYPTGGPSPSLRRWVLDLRSELLAAVGKVVDDQAGPRPDHVLQTAAQIIMGTIDTLTLSLLLEGSESPHSQSSSRPADLARTAAHLLVNGLKDA